MILITTYPPKSSRSDLAEYNVLKDCERNMNN